MEETKNKAAEYQKQSGSNSLIKKAKGLATSLVFGSIAMTAPMVSFANSSTDEFDDFKEGIEALITGSLGKGVALIALLLGGLIGLAKSSAWPALTGLAIAAIFGLGPFLIDTIFTTFDAIGN